MNERRIYLNDGRILGYAEYGAQDGRPILYFHGACSSRLSGISLNATAQSLNARIISIDRPGFGLSDFQPNRQILDWPTDIIELTKSLQLDKFAVLGFSSGAVYAAACALKIPNRLIRIAMVSCEAPYNIPTLKSGKQLLIRLASFAILNSPLFMRWSIKWSCLMAQNCPNFFFSRYKAQFPKVDRCALSSTNMNGCFIRNYLEAHKQGSLGAVWDIRLVAQPWKFNLGDVSKQVHIWHGGQDTISPINIGQFLVREIPNCAFKFYEDEGHISVFTNHIEEILHVLLS